MDKVPIVQDVMEETVFSFTPDTCVFEAMDKLIAKKRAGAPIIDEEGRLVGFLTEKDCLRLLAVSHQYNMTGRTVADIMSEIKESLNPNLDILSASSQFLACNFAVLPVIDGDKLVGSVSRLNMLQAIQKMFRARGRGMQQDKETLRLVESASSIDELQALVSKSNKRQLASVLGGRHGADKN